MSHLNNQNKFEKQLKEQFDSFVAKPNEAIWENIAQNLPADNFEKNIASKLNDLKVEPSERVWLTIEKHLPQIAKYSKNLVYLWTFAVLSIGLITGIFISKLTIETSQNKALTHPKAFVWFDTVQQNKQLVFENTPVLVPTLPAKTSLRENLTETNKVLINLEKSNIAVVNSNTQKSKPTAIVASNGILVNMQNTDSNYVIYNTKNISANKSGNISNNIVENNIATAKNNESTNGVLKEISAANKPKQVNLSTSSEPNNNSKDEMPTKVDSAVNLPKVQTTNTNQASENDYTGATLKRDKLTIIVYAGMGFSFMRYTEGTDRTNSGASLSLREKTERTESEISGGFLIGYDFSKRITLSSGIVMANFKQTMNFDRDTAKMPTGNYEGNLIYYNDTIFDGNNNSKALKYSYTEIPFFITYKIFESPKFEFAAQTGLGIGFLTGINTYVIAQNNIGVYEITNKDDFPAFKNTLFFTFQPQFTYNLSVSGTSIGFMPIIKTSLTNIVSDDKWLKQYPYNMSFNFFLRKRF
jgi:hypothetical protein